MPIRFGEQKTSSSAQSLGVDADGAISQAPSDLYANPGRKVRDAQAALIDRYADENGDPDEAVVASIRRTMQLL